MDRPDGTSIYGVFQASPTFESLPFPALLSNTPIPDEGHPPAAILPFPPQWSDTTIQVDLSSLPPYPKVTHPRLRDQAALDKSSRRLAGLTPWRKELACFRPLEKCGDAVLKAAWLMAIRERMSGEISGAVITKVVAPLLRNDTISCLMWGYGGFGMAHVRAGQECTMNNPYREQSTSADLFEAYVGAICSERGGFDRVVAWFLKMLENQVFPTLDNTMASMVKDEQHKVDTGPGQSTGKKRRAREAENLARRVKARAEEGDEPHHT